jgi:hypothetical protein
MLRDRREEPMGVGMTSIEAPAAPPAEPESSTRTAPAVVIALVLTAVVSIGAVALIAVIATRDHDPVTLHGDVLRAVGPTRADHWHAALGVYDCGRWVPNWSTPMSSSGFPAQAGTDDYAGLHSHGDGIIHMEPVSNRDTGRNATLGRYFTYAGFELSAASIDFVDVHDKNGESCNGEQGVLRWAVNGKEFLGNPADYKLFDGDVIELVFTTADASLPPLSAVPSYPALQSLLGGTTT